MASELYHLWWIMFNCLSVQYAVDRGTWRSTTTLSTQETWSPSLQSQYLFRAVRRNRCHQLGTEYTNSKIIQHSKQFVGSTNQEFFMLTYKIVCCVSRWLSFAICADFVPQLAQIDLSVLTVSLSSNKSTLRFMSLLSFEVIMQAVSIRMNKHILITWARELHACCHHITVFLTDDIEPF